MFRHPGSKPWEGDGIDVPFNLDTTWTFDVALRDVDGALIVAECKRTAGAVKQGAVAEFAHKVEKARKILNIPVAGLFITKKAHQRGAIKVGQCAGIKIVVLAEGATPPGFNITFLRYDRERERRLREMIMHVAPGSLRVTGSPINLIHRKSSDTPEIT